MRRRQRSSDRNTGKNRKSDLYREVRFTGNTKYKMSLHTGHLGKQNFDEAETERLTKT